MKTKTFFAAILLCSLTAISLNAAASATEKQERTLGSFTKINVGSAFKVFLKQGAEQSVSIEIDSEHIDDVITTVNNDVLTIKLSDNNKVFTNIKAMNVYITIPTINGIEASGAAKIQPETPINNSGAVSLNLSGAASFKDATVNCKSLKVEQSGASKCSLSVKAEDIDLAISGAGSLQVSGNVDQLKLNGSGAAKIDIHSLSYKNSDVKISGAAKLKR